MHKNLDQSNIMAQAENEGIELKHSYLEPLVEQTNTAIKGLHELNNLINIETPPSFSFEVVRASGDDWFVGFKYRHCGNDDPG